MHHFLNKMSYYMDEDFTPPSPPRPPPRPARTCSVVFLGETGAGKSCAVNALSLMSKRVTIENMPCVTKAETATVIDEDDEWAEGLVLKSFIIVSPYLLFLSV